VTCDRGAPGGPTDPATHPSTERLRALLDDDLPAADAREVADHLEGCERCVATLDDLEAPPVLPRAAAGGAPAWDERRMRRAVRRTVLRTAVNTVLLLVLAALLLQVIGGLAVHPMLVDRGGRLESHVTATVDLPVLVIPGAEGGELYSDPGVLRRTTEVVLHRAVASGLVPLGSFGTRTGPFEMTTTSGWDLRPGTASLRAGGDAGVGPSPFEPERLGEGTAVTVELQWMRPIDLEAADDVAAGSDDVALLWVGFRVPGAPRPQDPAWPLGYSACAEPWPYLSEMRSGGFGTSDATQRRFHGDDLGARHALDEVRRATANLAAIGWPAVDGPEGYGALADLDATADALSATEPGVASVVITGPTQAVAAAIGEHGPDQVRLLEIDFDRGAPGVCA
jgi:hypothetical protein